MELIAIARMAWRLGLEASKVPARGKTPSGAAAHSKRKDGQPVVGV